MIKRIYLCDKEVAMVIERSVMTISRVFGNPDKYRDRERALFAAAPEIIGGGRRWNIHKLSSALGVSEEEILAKIS